jgi:hypothetical protein
VGYPVEYPPSVAGHDSMDRQLVDEDEGTKELTFFSS